MIVNQQNIEKYGYISGMYALNLPCELDTCGDWHYSAYNWDSIKKYYKLNSFKLYGINCVFLKETQTYEFVANHIRAVLDLIQMGKYSAVEGFNQNYICNSKYDLDIFNKVSELKNNNEWDKIYLFMLKEYGKKWKKYLKEMTLCN